MKYAQYVREVLRTVKTVDTRERLNIAALGLGGEAGEVIDLIKKHLFHDHPLDDAKLIKELGDVLWYLTLLMQERHITLNEIMIANVAKLHTRYPDGFDSERSINRKEEPAHA